MSATNALTTTERSILPSAGDWSTMLSMAEVLVKSGLLPAHIKTPQAAVAVIQKGAELGIKPMYALSNIAVIQGKPTANAELMLALIYRDHGDMAITFVESNNSRCRVSYRRRGWTERSEYTFSAEDAATAGLSNGPNSATWKKYPAAMLRARCISAVARMAFPDSIGGMYTPEELGAEVDEDGAAVITARIEPRQAAQPIEHPARSAPLNVPRTTAGKASITEIQHLQAARKAAGWSDEDLYGVIAGNYPEAVRDGKPSVRELTSEQIDALIYIVETPVETDEDASVDFTEEEEAAMRARTAAAQQPALVDGGR